MSAADFTVEPIATLDMLERVYAFDKNSYGIAADLASANIPFPLFREWWDAFPTGFLCASRRGEPYVVLGLFPVTHAWATQFLEYQTSESELRADVIKGSNRRTWYFSGLSSKTRLGHVGGHLPCVLGRAMLKWAQINEQAIGGDVITLVAEGTTPIGAKLLGRLLGLESLVRLDDSRQKPRFKATTDLSAIRHLLVESPFFRRCRGLRDEVVSNLKTSAASPPRKSRSCSSPSF
jgi:hypothetical protein